jgi:hypothetical protein
MGEFGKYAGWLIGLLALKAVDYGLMGLGHLKGASLIAALAALVVTPFCLLNSALGVTLLSHGYLVTITLVQLAPRRH